MHVHTHIVLDSTIKELDSLQQLLVLIVGFIKYIGHATGHWNNYNTNDKDLSYI